MTELATTGKPGTLQPHTTPVEALEKRLRTEKQLLLLPPAATTLTTVVDTALHNQMMASLAVGGPDMLLVGLGGGVITSTVVTGAALVTMACTGTMDALPTLKRVLIGAAGSGFALTLFGGHPLIVGGYYVVALAGTLPWFKNRFGAVRALRAEVCAAREREDRRTLDEGYEAPADVVDGEIVTTTMPADLQGYVQRWVAGVAKDTLAGSELINGRSLPDGRVSFVVQGGPQGVQLQAVNALREKIASSLKLALPHPELGGGQTVVFDQPGGGVLADRSQLRMQIINLSSTTAAGGRVTAEVVSAPGNPYSVRIGGYIDDGTPTFWDLADHDGAYSGVVVAGTNMGKSSVSDQLGYRIRQFGWELAYLDPQRGASSQVLAQHADFPVLGVEHAESFLRFLEDAANTREEWIAAHPEVGVITPDLVAPCAPAGVNPDPGCPCGGVVPLPLFALIDECDQVFNALVAGSSTKLGERFGVLAKRIRKLCMGILACTQIPELKTFGGSELLRSNLPVRNLLAMHVSSNVSGTLIPGLPYSPKLLPKISGRGLMCGQASRQMETVLDWMPRRQKADLVCGPYAEDLFEALPHRPLYVLDVRSARSSLPAGGVDATARNRDDARARLAVRFTGQPLPLPAFVEVPAVAKPLVSWPVAVRTPSARELEAMLDAPGGVVGEVLAALEPVADDVWVTVGDLARMVGRVPEGADTALVRARARDLSAELAAAGRDLPVRRRADGMSATAAEIRAALT